MCASGWEHFSDPPSAWLFTLGQFFFPDADAQGKSLWGLIDLVLILSLKFPLNCNYPGAVDFDSFLNWFRGRVKT